LALLFPSARVIHEHERGTHRERKKHMTTFTIDAENNITVHESRKAAKETGAAVFSTEEQFADAIGNDSKRLIEIWNSLPGVTPVKKFTNRKVATERIWKAIQGLAGPVATELTATESTATEPTPEATSVPVPSPNPETPFDDPEPTPDAVANEHQAAIESAADHVVPPATPEAGAELATASAQEPNVAPAKPKATREATAAKDASKGKKRAKAKDVKAKDDAGPRQGSKTAQVITLLQRKGGATLTEIMEKMSWQRHTVRGFMAGAMKKAGYAVESFKNATDERTYRINK
jgi:hypothetical protein